MTVEGDVKANPFPQRAGLGGGGRIAGNFVAWERPVAFACESGAGPGFRAATDD
jgi:hypothetical protein